MDPAPLSITARRNVVFQEEWTFSEDGVELDLTSAVATLEIRLFPQQPGNPLLRLETVQQGGVQGLLFAGGGRLVITIGQGSLAALPSLGEAGSASSFSYDLVVHEAGRFPATWTEGEFRLLPGVTVGAA